MHPTPPRTSARGECGCAGDGCSILWRRVRACVCAYADDGCSIRSDHVRACVCVCCRLIISVGCKTNTFNTPGIADREGKEVRVRAEPETPEFASPRQGSTLLRSTGYTAHCIIHHAPPPRVYTVGGGCSFWSPFYSDVLIHSTNIDVLLSIYCQGILSEAFAPCTANSVENCGMLRTCGYTWHTASRDQTAVNLYRCWRRVSMNIQPM